MRVDANPAATATAVTGAIRQAARVTGTNFQYLLAAAKVESNLDPGAAAKSSSAGGLFQFIDQTWLGTLKQAGPALGYGRYADAIGKNRAGRYVVSDPGLRSEIMNLRQDPAANAVMAGAFTKANAAQLAQDINRYPTENELYIAHFLGARGAARLIKLASATPNASAADTFPNAARANRSIFYSEDGRPRSFADVARVLSGRFDVARAQVPQDKGAPQRAASAANSARVARAYEAASPGAAGPAAAPAIAKEAVPQPDDAQFAFRNPYREAARRPPVASVAPVVSVVSAAPAAPVGTVVAELWSGPKPAADPAAAAAPASAPSDRRRKAVAANEPLGLFQEMQPNVRALFTGG